jgi:hypothetical protein
MVQMVSVTVMAGGGVVSGKAGVAVVVLVAAVAVMVMIVMVVVWRCGTWL